MINIYTDGSVKDAKGGYAYIIVLHGMTITAKFHSNSKDINHLELLAVVEALEVIQDSKQITVYTDSNYVINCAKSKDFKFYYGRKKKARLRRKLTFLLERHQVTFITVHKAENNCLHRQAHYLAREATTYL